MKIFYTLALAAAVLFASEDSMAKKKPSKRKVKHSVSQIHKNVKATKGGIAKRSSIVRGNEVNAPANVAVQSSQVHKNARATTGGIPKRSSN